MANNIVSKHVLDIEALLSTKIDEKSWKANRELLKKGIENLKPLFDTESAEVNAKKLAEIFNKAFTKASMPEIGFEDIIDNIDAMTSKFEEALGKINNIDTSALGNIEMAINSIGETTNKIFDKLDNGVQTAGNNIKKNANIIIKSISEIKTAAAKLDNESLNSIQETLNYNGKETKGKQLKDIESLMAERTAVDAQGNHTFNQLPWEEQYKWFVKYTVAYQNYQKIAPKKDFENLPEKYKKAYNEALPRSFEARDMLQNIINVNQGKELVGYDKGAPWARESTLKEVLGVLKGGIQVHDNDKTVDNSYSNNTESSSQYENQSNKSENLDISNASLEEYTRTCQEAEAAYDASVKKVEVIREELEKASIELEKIQKTSDTYGYTSNMSSREAGRVQSILNKPVDKDFPNYSRNQHVVDMLKKGYKLQGPAVGVETLANAHDNYLVGSQDKEAERVLQDSIKDFFRSNNIEITEDKIKNTTSSLLSYNKLAYNEDGDLLPNFNSFIYKNILGNLSNSSQTYASDYGFSINENEYKQITQTEYEYAKYLQTKISELNVGFEEGLKILESQNTQLEEAKRKVDELRSAEAVAVSESEAAYEQQALAHNGRLHSTESNENPSSNGKTDIENIAEQDKIVERYNVNKQKTLDLLAKEKLSLEDIKYLLSERDAGYGKTFYDNKNDDLGHEALDLERDISAKLLRGDMVTPAIQNAVQGVTGTRDENAQVLFDYQNAQLSVSNTLGLIDTQIEDEISNQERENGTLEERIELLRDIAEQYTGDWESKLTNASRNKLDRLNSLDRDLTPKEEDELYDLENKINEADQAMAELEETYKRIVINFEDGSKKIINPDQSGLNALYDYQANTIDGTDMNGKEISNVVFERIEKEAEARLENAEAAKVESDIVKKSNEIKNELNSSLKQQQQVEKSSEISDNISETSSIKEQNNALKENIELKRNIPDYSMQPEQGKMILYHNTSSKNVDSILKNGLKADAGKEQGRGKDGDFVWATSTPNQKGYGGNTIAFTIDVSVADKYKANDTEYTLPMDIPAEDILFADRPTGGEGGQARESDIYERVKKFGADKVREVYSNRQDSDVSDARIEELITEADARLKVAQAAQEEQIAVEKVAEAKKSEPVSNNEISEESINEQPAQAETQIEQNDSGAPWAREDTLKGEIKAILDNIQKNTSIDENQKTENPLGDEAIAKISEAISKIEVTSDLTTEGLATQETVASIAEAVTSINNKLVQGTKVVNAKSDNSEGNKEKKSKKKSIKDKGNKLQTPNSSEPKIGGSEEEQRRIIENEKKINAEKENNSNATKKQNESEKQRKATIKEIEGIYDKLGTLDAKALTANSESERDIYKRQIIELEQLVDLKEKGLSIDKESLNTRRAKARGNTIDKYDISQSKTEVRQSRQAAKFGRAETVLTNSNQLKNQLGVLDASGINIQDNNQVNEFYNSLTKLQELYSRLYNQKGIISQEDIVSLTNARNETKQYYDVVKSLTKEIQLADNQEFLSIGGQDQFVSGDVSTYRAQLEQMVMQLTNGKAQIGDFDSKTNTLNYTLKTGKRELSNFSLSVNGLDKSVTKTTGSVKRIETFMDGIIRKTKEIGQYLVGSNAIYRVWNQLKQGITYVKEIDAALTELKKVTDETEKTYDNFLNTAAKTASKVGSTIKEVVSSTADFARLGSILAKTNIRPIIQ